MISALCDQIIREKHSMHVAANPTRKTARTRRSLAGVIWLASARLRMRPYRRAACTSSPILASCWAVVAGSVGRMASCASCAWVDLHGRGGGRELSKHKE